MDRKLHWEKIYDTKEVNEVSWYQPIPQLGLDLINKYTSSKEEAIIDVGGGDSFLPDHLLENGFQNVTVLDISQNAITRAKNRLYSKASLINWVVSDITEYCSVAKYKIWYDRAAFHFLREDADIQKYLKGLDAHTNSGSIIIIGTFSENGPLKCSGIEIKQYSKDELVETLGEKYELLEFINIDHPTPFDTIQNFNFGVFRKA